MKKKQAGVYIMIKNAAIMAGGQSRRFNRDKTLELFRGKRLIEYGVDTLKSVAENVVVVAKDSDKYSFLDIEFVHDEYEIQCPMVGILTALKHFRSDIFVVAADTPFVMGKHAERLMSALKGHSAAVPFIKGKHHPLYACYGIGIIDIFEDALKRGDFALMKCLFAADAVFPDENELCDSDEETSAFININTQDDLKNVVKSF